MRLIDADALNEVFGIGRDCDHCEIGRERCEEDSRLSTIEICGVIAEMLTVDAVEVKHGHWIIEDDPRTGWYRVTCSECKEDVTSVAPVIGFFPNAKVTWDFCPNCGAKMDEVKYGNI